MPTEREALKESVERMRRLREEAQRAGKRIREEGEKEKPEEG